MIEIEVTLLPQNKSLKLKLDDDFRIIERFREWFEKTHKKDLLIPLKYCSVAVNGKVVNRHFQLKHGDIVKILPSIGGG